MSLDCIFCRVICGEIPSKKILENDHFICIQDIQPQAPVHWLVIPKVHHESLSTLFKANLKEGASLMGQLYEFANQVVLKSEQLSQGFRSVINTGASGGQSVPHIHLHLLGGGSLSGRFA